MKKSAFCFGTIAAMALTACGGGSSSSSNNSVDDLSESGIELIERLALLPETDTLDMPVSGTARYDGYAAYSSSTSDPVRIVSDPDTLSEVQLTANFGSSTISGSATNFQSYEGVDIDGALAITNGTIVDATLTADIGGTLTEDGVNVSYDGEIQGGFLGEDAEAIAGTGYADASVLGTFVGTGYAVFGAER